MIDFDKVPVIKGLKFYKEQSNALFHMPGHKQNSDAFEELRYLRENMLEFDVTEVEGTDNMFMPEDMIRESVDLLSAAMKARKSFFLVNGSTCGVYSMILGLIPKRSRMIVQRNCHKSVHAALYLGDIEPVYVYPDMNESFSFASCPSLESIKTAYMQNPDIAAVMITSPTYYGTIANISGIAEFCRLNDIMLLVDEAHGAHLGFSTKLPKTALELGAHASVTSFHKTLPALTQTAVLNLSDKISESQTKKVRSQMEIFQSSSPSYLFMASIDIARYIMQERGEQLIDDLIESLSWFKDSLWDHPFIRILSEEDLREERFDPTRLVINTPMPAGELSQLLRKKYSIQIEMSDFNNLVLICTVADTIEMYQKLSLALRDIFSGYREAISSSGSIDTDNKDRVSNNRFRSLEDPDAKLCFSEMPRPVIMISQREAEMTENTEIPLEIAIGRICAETVTPYPPGIPLLLAGEKITPEIISYIKKLKQKNMRIIKSISENKDFIAVLDQ